MKTRLFILGERHRFQIAKITRKSFLKKQQPQKTPLLTFNSHIIYFTHLKVNHSMVFSIFTDTCNYHHNQFSSSPKAVSCCSVTQLYPTLCDPMNCKTPGLPVHHQIPELAQTHVHWVSDAIQPSHFLSSPSPPAFNLSQHQGLSQWVSSSHQVTKVLELQLQRQSFQWIFRVDFL